MSTADAPRTARFDVARSAPDALTAEIHAADGAFYSFHLFRGADLTTSTAYARNTTHTFGGLEPGTYRCRVFVRTRNEERYALSGERVVIEAGAHTPPPVPTLARWETSPTAAPGPRWATESELPLDSDYSRFLPAVTVWGSVQEFVNAAEWVPGVNVVRLQRDLHVDLFLSGDFSAIPQGRGLPVIFSAAVSTRAGKPGPFFSGIDLAKSVDSPFVAISDAMLNVDRELTLSWYAGRRWDGLQRATLAILTATQRRHDRELVLVGGSGGGFAALFNAVRLEVPTSAFVWNPQTDLLDYQPRAVEQYLSLALPAGADHVATLTREQRSEALLAGGVEHRVIRGDGPARQRRLLYLQNSGDSHVISHLAPFVARAGLRHTGGGRYVDDSGALALVSAFGEGHDPPPRDVLVEGLRAMLDTSASAADVIDGLQGRQLLPSTDLEVLPRDLRGEADRIRASVALRATREESGQMRAALQWTDLPNGYGGISTAFDFSGSGAPFTRSHRHNNVLVQDDDGAVEQVTARVRDGHLNELFSLHATVEPVPVRLRTFVVGSCVSRDVFGFLDPGHFELTGYVARQSLVSAFGPATPPPVDPSAFASAFQRRMLEADARSALPEQLREAADGVDLLLWDLFDERLGLLDHTGGGTSTVSVELRGVLTGDLPGHLRHTRFGSQAHFERFAAALNSWRDLLAQLGLLGRTVLVAPPWATTTTTGEVAPTSFGLDPAQANLVTEVYLSRAQEVLGVPAVGRALSSVQALPSHQWGLAPFHYDDWTYERLATEISDVAQHLCQPFGWGEGDPHGRTRIPTGAQRTPAGTSTPTLEIRQTGPLQVTATVTASQAQATAFSLHAGGQRLALTPYARTRSHVFTVPKPDIYRCRAFVLRADGERVPVASQPLRVH